MPSDPHAVRERETRGLRAHVAASTSRFYGNRWVTTVFFFFSPPGGALSHLPAVSWPGQHFTHTPNCVPQKTPHPQQGRAPRTLSKPRERGNLDAEHAGRDGLWPGSGSVATGVPGPRPKVSVPELTLREAARLRLQRRKPGTLGTNVRRRAHPWPSGLSGSERSRNTRF